MILLDTQLWLGENHICLIFPLLRVSLVDFFLAVSVSTSLPRRHVPRLINNRPGKLNEKHMLLRECSPFFQDEFEIHMQSHLTMESVLDRQFGVH
jgi:hypothetical protein